MAYPAAVDSFTTKVDASDDVLAAHINAVQTSIVNIETELGVDPAGTATDVVTRFAQAHDGVGNLDFATSGALTLATGAIVPTQNYHTVLCEGAAASDDLDTITATNCTDGFVLVLRQGNSAQDVTIKHATGNIYCPGAVDVALSLDSHIALLIYDVGNTRWNLQGVLNAALVNKANTFTLTQTFSAAVNYAYTSVSTGTTLSASHNTVDGDATGGAFDVTLPTAASIAGRQYTIRKLDAGANAITVKCSGAETINGAATYTGLDTQYDAVTLMSNGTNWIILNIYP